MAPNRLNLVRPCPSENPAEKSQPPLEAAKATIAPKRQTDPKQLDELSRDSRRSKSGVEESKSDSTGTEASVVADVVPSRSAVSLATTAPSNAAVGTTTNFLSHTPGSSRGGAPGQIVKSGRSTISLKSSSIRTSSSTGRDVFRPIQAPSFLNAPNVTSPGSHSKGGELSLGASDEADDVISWSDAGAAVVWHTQALHCDLFEGHGAYERRTF